MRPLPDSALALCALLALAACSSEQAPLKSESAHTQARVQPDAPAGAPTASASTETQASRLHAIGFHTLEGRPASLGDFAGKALLVVNVASKCGLTPQYEQLEALQERYGPRGFSVIGFPCNQFMGQEPGSAEQIREFCSSTYGVTFPLMEKIEVNGARRHPLYELLTAVPDEQGKAGDVQWNFEKFVLSPDGTTIVRFRPRTKPDDPAVIAAIERVLPG